MLNRAAAAVCERRWPRSLRAALRAPLPWTLAVVLLLTACGERKDRAGESVAARVGKEEIRVQQIEAVLQQQRGLRPEQVDVAARQALERLIDQQLALQQAAELDLERDARVQQQIEAARREVLARAYVEKVGEGAVKPTAEETRKVYDDKPALFSARRIYHLQEIAIEARPEQLAALREQVAAARQVNEVVEYLRTNGLHFTLNRAVRSPGQLPPASLEALARLQDGQAMVLPTAAGMQVVILARSFSQPLSLEQARPAIEQLVLNERRRKLVEDDLKSLRAAATIEYVGKFAERPASAAAATARTDAASK